MRERDGKRWKEKIIGICIYVCVYVCVPVYISVCVLLQERMCKNDSGNT